MPIRVKMPHCWQSHVAAYISKTEEMTDDSCRDQARGQLGQNSRPRAEILP